MPDFGDLLGNIASGAANLLNPAELAVQGVQNVMAAHDAGASNFDAAKALGNNDATQLLSKTINAIPGGQFILDLPNRSVDTVAQVAQNADRVGWLNRDDAGNLNNGAALASVFNTDVWDKAWNTWGQQGHVTLGQYLGNQAVNNPAQPELRYFDPFDAQSSQVVRANIKDSWGADLFAGATDMAAGFISPPGTGLLKAARLSKVADLANVEKITDIWNSADGAAGLKATPVADTLRTVVAPRTGVNADATVASQAAQFHASVAATDSITSEAQMLDHIGPWMSGATEQAKTTLASMLTQANKSHVDPAMAQQVKGNIILAAMGSTGAKRELANVDPLIARQLQNVGRAPDELTLEARLQQARATDAEYDPGTILAQHFDTPGAQAEIAALKDRLARDTDAAAQARSLSLEAKAQVPDAYGTFDSQRLAESRLMAKQNIADLQQKIAQAKADVEGSARFEAASGKDAAAQGGKDAVAEAQSFAAGRGAAQGRLSELQTQLKQAQADHDLLHQTPLKNPEYDDAKAAAADANEQRKATLQTRQQTEAELRIRKQDLQTRKAAMAQLRPAVTKANDWLNDVDNLGTNGYVMTGRVSPSRLDRVKTAFRNTVGDEYLYNVSDANRNIVFRTIPNGGEVLSAIGTPRARGAINLAEVASKGARELGESLKRSKAFNGDEIRSATDELIGTPAGRRQNVVARWENEMLNRIAQRNGLNPQQAKALVKKSTTAYAKGRTYLATALRKADEAGDSRVLIDAPDGEAVAFPGAGLRSHLADTAPFIDPDRFEREIFNKQDKHLAGELFDNLDELNSRLQGIWKHAVLLRPGLGVRAMLDTELRAIALIGAGTQFANAANGVMRLKAARAAQGATLKGLEKIGLDTTPLPRVALDSMGHKSFSVDIGAGHTADFAAYKDAADMAAQRMAMTNGESASGALLGSTTRYMDRLSLDSSQWVKYKADSDVWPAMYSQHAQTLLASPTVRKMLQDHAADGVTHETVDGYVRELFQDPEVRKEYQNILLDQKVTKVDFVESLVNETRLMFPSPEVVDDLVKGGLSNRKVAASWVEKHFPPEERFNIPGPTSVLNDRNLSFRLKKATDAFFRTVLDQPDFWMARHPVFVTMFRRNLQAEAKSLLEYRRQQYGEDAMLSAQDLKTLEARARTASMQLVKNSFFDTTRQTSAHHYVTKISPFFNAWEDAAMSWSKLLYDDPSRLFKLGGAWNSFGNAGQWMPKPLVIDGDGKPLLPGQDDNGKGRYIALPGFMGTNLRINMQALNSISQGEVAWLPGFGPTTQVATTYFLGDALPKDLVLKMVGTDNPVFKPLLQSMFLGGEVPKSGAGDIAMSTIPAWMRNLYSDSFGDNMAMNASFYANQKYIEAQKNGTPFDATKAIEDGRKQAQTAAIIRVVSGGGLGLSGRATVEGQFYVDQMHQLQALSPDQLKQMGYPDATAAFSALFPEAAKLDWRLSRNETGISATVGAQTAAVAHSALIDKYPDLGWFIVGSDNVGGQFSQTAYNQQAGMTYGLTEQGRKRESVDQTLNGAVVSQGWDKYAKYTAELSDAAMQYGLTPTQVSQVKAVLVEKLGAQNTEWYRAYNDRVNKLASFYNEADQLAAGPLKDREDMKLYTDYRNARQQVMDAMGIKSLTGSSAQSAQARAVLTMVGTKLGTQNLGFQQMWDRMLSAEVKPLPTDVQKLGA